jgi:alkylhydroperoxidase/carboxymuconolactone decarboxylase family protein YurZ
MDKQKFDQGLAVRREVLGDEYVDKAVAATTDFTRPMQELLNENCWGTIWTRAGLPRKTRSLVTLAFLSALRATAEIKARAGRCATAAGGNPECPAGVGLLGCRRSSLPAAKEVTTPGRLTALPHADHHPVARSAKRFIP